MQLIAPEIIVIVPAHGRTGQFVQQTTSRVRCPTEEALVADGHPEYRQLHARDQCLHRRRQFTVFENKIKQHGHQADDIVINSRHSLGTATLHPLLMQQLLDVTAQTILPSVAGKALCGYLGQHAQQLTGPHRNATR